MDWDNLGRSPTLPLSSLSGRPCAGDDSGDVGENNGINESFGPAAGASSRPAVTPAAADGEGLGGYLSGGEGRAESYLSVRSFSSLSPSGHRTDVYSSPRFGSLSAPPLWSGPGSAEERGPNRCTINSLEFTQYRSYARHALSAVRGDRDSGGAGTLRSFPPPPPVDNGRGEDNVGGEERTEQGSAEGEGMSTSTPVSSAAQSPYFDRKDFTKHTWSEVLSEWGEFGAPPAVGLALVAGAAVVVIHPFVALAGAVWAVGMLHAVEQG